MTGDSEHARGVVAKSLTTESLSKAVMTARVIRGRIQIRKRINVAHSLGAHTAVGEEGGLASSPNYGMEHTCDITQWNLLPIIIGEKTPDGFSQEKNWGTLKNLKTSLECGIACRLQVLGEEEHAELGRKMIC